MKDVSRSTSQKHLQSQNLVSQFFFYKDKGFCICNDPITLKVTPLNYFYSELQADSMFYTLEHQNIQMKRIEEKQQSWKVAKTQLKQAKRRLEDAKRKQEEARKFQSQLNEISRELFMKQCQQCTKKQQYFLHVNYAKVNKEYLKCWKELKRRQIDYYDKKKQEEKAWRQKIDEPGKIVHKYICNKLNSIKNSLFKKKTQSYEKVSDSEKESNQVEKEKPLAKDILQNKFEGKGIKENVEVKK